MDDSVDVVRGLTYGPSGRRLDVHRPPGGPEGTVLLWHGRGRDERDVLAPLAREVAALGLLVLVPDWRSNEPDGGWTQLRESVAFLRDRAGDWGGDAERTVLAGWSLGARAAMATVLRPAAPTEGWRPVAVVGIAGNYLTSSDCRMGPAAVDDVVTTAETPVPLWLHHGVADAVVDVASPRGFAPVAEAHGWFTHCTESASDHAGVVLTEYDRELGRCRPARAEHAVHAGQTTAQLIAKAAADC